LLLADGVWHIAKELIRDQRHAICDKRPLQGDHMGFHHTAFATRDLQATHKFYSEAMGFELVKVVAAPTPDGGWAKHLFFETGTDEYIAFWDLHDDTLPATWSPAISTSQGLPIWVNHLAFRATDLADIEARKQRWLAHGHTVSEIDHGWCTSIYAVDPNGILVEFCTTTQAMTAKDREEARRLLADPNPPLEVPPQVKIHHPSQAA
jgi:catechol 2,3-dioxygenase-like lactoylglutathione lyase family enzyme